MFRPGPMDHVLTHLEGVVSAAVEDTALTGHPNSEGETMENVKPSDCRKQSVRPDDKVTASGIRVSITAIPATCAARFEARCPSRSITEGIEVPAPAIRAPSSSPPAAGDLPAIKSNLLWRMQLPIVVRLCALRLTLARVAIDPLSDSPGLPMRWCPSRDAKTRRETWAGHRGWAIDSAAQKAAVGLVEAAPRRYRVGRRTAEPGRGG
jgi:hypothetical protein